MNVLEMYPNLKRALDLLDESNYTKEELEEYDRQMESKQAWDKSIELAFENAKKAGFEHQKNQILQIFESLKKGKAISDVASDFNIDIKDVEKWSAEYSALISSK